MKIKYLDGTEEDTDKMDDLTAELMERTKQYLDFCCSRGVAVYCKFYNPAQKEHSGFCNFNNKIGDMYIIINYLIKDLEELTGNKVKLI